MTPQNPFIVTGRFHPDYFCDRKQETASLVSNIENGRNTVLISPRRMGKTGLIQHCFDSPKIKGEYNTFYIDILQTSSLQEFTFILGKSIFDQLAAAGRRMLMGFISVLKSVAGSFGIDPISGQPTFDLQIGRIRNPEFTLDEIFSYLESSPAKCVVAIDEFQQIGKYPEKNVEAMLRSRIQRCSNSVFVFAGSEYHMMSQMFLSSSRPFYNSASLMTLRAIDRGVYVEFASSLFKSRAKSIDSSVIEDAYDMFGGLTFYMQKAMNQIFGNTSEGSTAGEDELRVAVDEMLYANDVFYREVLSRMPDSRKRVLLAVAAEAKAENVLSADFVGKYALVSASSVQSALRRLVDDGLVTRSENAYGITDPLFRIWIRRTY